MGILKLIKKNIKLHAPIISSEEKKSVNDAVKSGWLSSAGKYVGLFENKISKLNKSKYTASIINGTSALNISLKLIGIKSYDEIIVPTVTFIAPVNAVLYHGAKPVFMDCDDYLNIDTKKIIKFLDEETFYKNGYSYNKKTKNRILAIIVVHVFGNLCDLSKIYNVCKKKNIKIIEDASEALGSRFSAGKFKGKHAGTIGEFGCLSFNINKIVTSGGGGAILTQKKRDYLKIKKIINQAKSNPFYFIHDEIGYNLGLSNIHASIGYSQMKKFNFIINSKRKIYSFYYNMIKSNKNYEILKNPDYCFSNRWLTIIKISNSKINRETIFKKFQDQNIEVRPLWQLGHKQKYLKKFQAYNIKNANRLLNKIICLPSSYFLKERELMRVIKCLEK